MQNTTGFLQKAIKVKLNPKSENSKVQVKNIKFLIFNF